MDFKLIKTAKAGKARVATLTTKHSEIATPVFMPVGTNATVKTLSQDELKTCGAQIILSNTYHNYLKPGEDTVKALGGLHSFMNWDRSILTDSGGFQVFSLSALNKISEEGVEFRSHHDGSKIFFTPESVTITQKKLGSDIVMPLDQCIELPTEKSKIIESVQRTLRWLDRALTVPLQDYQRMFGIVQGGTDPELRKFSAQETIQRDCFGYSIGGLSVGEAKPLMYESVDVVTEILPSDKPRYLMGVGTPIDIIEAVDRGVDMFDCVMPTRNARNGNLFTDYGQIMIKKKQYALMDEPISINCKCYTCQNHSLAYLHHLHRCKEVLGIRLNTIHNIHYYLSLMQKIREAIFEDRFVEFKRDYLAKWKSSN
ncbi:MAG TPA: tRNA guanosine(34) transglycosylase Tgt [Oligoflexia bacterium]|nr:tRNA guanosine(34) transglycosylase Tgt [Oligoflexia bacterium]HMR24124.1 tRNA guanosine(34) transglycosylase Tgt [Oligoflexia bacterium]